MKVAISYISSDYKFKDTIKKINLSNADFIHVDLMDGKYVENKTFNRFNIKKVFKLAKKKLDVHFMTDNPEKYLKLIKDFHLVKNVYFHPETTSDPENFIIECKRYGFSPGIVINPDEEVDKYIKYFKNIDRILVMSVKPGKGGQKFMTKTPERLSKLIELRKKNKDHFEIAVDGGINDKTITKINKLDINYVISGSFVCKSEDYNKQILLLKKD